MRKALVLLGPKASGKTWTSQGIENFFPLKHLRVSRKNLDLRLKDEILPKSYRGPDGNHSDLINYKLIVIDECRTVEYITSLERIRERFSKKNFIFCISKYVDYSNLNAEMYHLVELPGVGYNNAF